MLPYVVTIVVLVVISIEEEKGKPAAGCFGSFVLQEKPGNGRGRFQERRGIMVYVHLAEGFEEIEKLFGPSSIC